MFVIDVGGIMNKKEKKEYMKKWHKDHPEYMKENYIENKERILK